MSQGVPNGQIACFTARKLAQIQCQAGESSFRSTLAHLRQGIGRVPGDMPQLWGFFLSEMPEKWMGNSEPSKAEWAIYLALTLFALHQQGQDPNIALSLIHIWQQEHRSLLPALDCIMKTTRKASGQAADKVRGAGAVSYTHLPDRCRYMWFSYLFCASEMKLDLVNNDWWDAVTTPYDNTLD